jgi:hypothetical protein
MAAFELPRCLHFITFGRQHSGVPLVAACSVWLTLDEGTAS